MDQRKEIRQENHIQSLGNSQCGAHVQSLGNSQCGAHVGKGERFRNQNNEKNGRTITWMPLTTSIPPHRFTGLRCKNRPLRWTVHLPTGAVELLQILASAWRPMKASTMARTTRSLDSMVIVGSGRIKSLQRVCGSTATALMDDPITKEPCRTGGRRRQMDDDGANAEIGHYWEATDFSLPHSTLL